MKRRDFIKLSSAAMAGAVAGGHAQAATNQKVIIIGAGMAGMAAAKTLKDKGHTVTVLEAKNRIGGRIHTSSKWPDAPTDLGASWIHEPKGNPLTPLADKIRARRIATRYTSAATYDEAGGLISPQVKADYLKMQTDLRDLWSAAQNDDAESNLDFVTQRDLAGYGWSTTNNYHLKLTNHVTVSETELEYAGASGKLSSYWWDNMGSYSGDDVVLPDGYIALVNSLAFGVNVQLNQIVSKIAHTSSGVTVTTNQGTFTGERVIVTVPLGVLKKNQITFSPALPTAKLNAINKLGMGTLGKVFLRFPSVFWANVDWLEYMDSPAKRGHWQQWLNVARVSGGKPILLAFSGADFAEASEGWSDAQIVESAMVSLRAMYGNNIPAPVDYQLTRWHLDPFSYGAYSFNAQGSTPTMRNDLAAHINKRVFFAGEATQKMMFATVHGAYLSGIVAANGIINA